MVTGDQHAIAVETSKRLGLGTNILEGAALMKADNFEELCKEVNPQREIDYVLRNRPA